MNLKNRAGTPIQHERIKINSTISRDSVKYAKIFKPKERRIFATDSDFIKLQLFHDKLKAENVSKINESGKHAQKNKN